MHDSRNWFDPILWFHDFPNVSVNRRHPPNGWCCIRLCLHDTTSSFNPEWARSGFSILPLVTLHLSAQCLHESGTKVKPFRIEFAPGSRSGSKLSIQCEILFRNHINGDRSSFRNETGSRPGQRTRSLVFLWFSAGSSSIRYHVNSP